MAYCRKCGKGIMFMAMEPTPGLPEPKMNPIEIGPVEDGNLFVDQATNLYRIATKEELAKARMNNRPLWISHFARCPGAKDFKRK